MAVVQAAYTSRPWNACHFLPSKRHLESQPVGGQMNVFTRPALLAVAQLLKLRQAALVVLRAAHVLRTPHHAILQDCPCRV